MTGDAEFSGRKADSVEKALKAWEARVKCWVWDRAGSSICASMLSLWKEKHELKVSVQPVIVRKTKQATKRVCSGSMSSASIPATEVPFINSCEALGYRRRWYQCIRQALLGLISSCHCTALTHSTWIFFWHKAADIMKFFFLQEQITNHFKFRTICRGKTLFSAVGMRYFLRAVHQSAFISLVSYYLGQ